MLPKLLVFTTASLGKFIARALGMIASQPGFKVKRKAQATDLNSIKHDESRAEPLPLRDVEMRDGQSASVGDLPSGPEKPGAPLLVMVHGSGWQDGQFSKLALAPQTLALNREFLS